MKRQNKQNKQNNQINNKIINNNKSLDSFKNKNKSKVKSVNSTFKKIFSLCYYSFPLILFINIFIKLIKFVDLNGIKNIKQLDNNNHSIYLYTITMCISPVQYYICCSYPHILKQLANECNLSPIYFTHYIVLLLSFLKPITYLIMIDFKYSEFRYYYSIYPFISNYIILYTDIILICYLVFGQYLNYSTYKNIGIRGVNYGLYFGEKIPWSYDFPFNLNIKHPQYLGVIYTLSVLNVMVTPIHKIKYLLFSFWVILISYYFNIKVEK
tara:strand:- start:212 stop:1015 length:804 start_codon:yes stop_codon:yes gene_type:complete